MPAALLLLIVLVGVVAGVLGTARTGAAVLVGTWLLVPAAARLPGTGAGPLFIHRVVIAAVLCGVLLRAGSKRAEGTLFAPRGVHVAFAAFVTLAAGIGVVFADVGTTPRQNVDGWLLIIEQAAYFVTALAVFRECGAGRSVLVISAVAGLLAIVVIIEQLTGWSYARWMASGIPDPDGLMRFPLEERGSHRRVRGTATFALELGWVAAMLVPITIAGAAIGFRDRLASLFAARVRIVIPVVLLAGLIWSWSRSAYAGLAIGVVAVLLGLVLDRPRQVALVALGCAAVVAVVAQGPLQETIELASVAGEEDIRFQRLPEILELVAERPLVGLGLGGLLGNNVRVADNSWVVTYATLGVIGVVALCALILTALHSASRFVRAGPGEARVIAAAAAGAVASSVIGLAAYDFSTLRMSTEALWGLTALALVANEELGVLHTPMRVRGLTPRVMALAALGCALGAAVALAVPARSTADAVFTTISPAVAAGAPTGQDFTARVLSQTACQVVEGVPPPGTVECRDQDHLAGGIGLVRIEARSDDEVDRLLHDVAAALDASFPSATMQLRASGRGVPTAAATAPLWATFLGGAVGALLPVTPASERSSDPRAPAPASPGRARRRSRRPTPGG